MSDPIADFIQGKKFYPPGSVVHEIDAMIDDWRRRNIRDFDQWQRGPISAKPGSGAMMRELLDRGIRPGLYYKYGFRPCLLRRKE